MGSLLSSPGCGKQIGEILSVNCVNAGENLEKPSLITFFCNVWSYLMAKVLIIISYTVKSKVLFTLYALVTNLLYSARFGQN